MGLLNTEDATLHIEWFKEMAHLIGIAVKFQYPLSPSYEIHSQQSSKEYSDPVDIDIIYDENPKVSTLKAIGWISEDSSDKPLIARLPYDLDHVGAECRLIIPPPRELGDGRIFRITGIYTINEYPDCWICTLAPVFKSEDPKTDYSSSSINYINEDLIQ